jgi:hypothetical protein
MDPDFEEKQYENAANGELRLYSSNSYTPGQVAEGILGFDAASNQPWWSDVWRAMQMGAPAGLQLTPNLWPIARQPGPNVVLPSFVVSLILQYKRSEYMHGKTAAQYNHWRQPYYRFEIDVDQHRQLMSIETAASNLAAVKYAAPVFYQYRELERLQLSEEILLNSNFVSPNTIGSTHRHWTYNASGGMGYANPEGEELNSGSWRDVNRELADIRTVANVLTYLRRLANALVAAELVEAGAQVDRFELGLQLDDDRRQGIVDLLTVGRVLGRYAQSWWLQVLPA